jgi:hypothetical protein
METAALWKPWKNELHVFPPFPQRLENSAKDVPTFPQFPQPLLLLVTIRRKEKERRFSEHTGTLAGTNASADFMANRTCRVLLKADILICYEQIYRFSRFGVQVSLSDLWLPNSLIVG